MPLCDRCRSEADYTVNGTSHAGERDSTLPAGLETGVTCDRCGLSGE